MEQYNKRLPLTPGLKRYTSDQWDLSSRGRYKSDILSDMYHSRLFYMSVNPHGRKIYPWNIGHIGSLSSMGQPKLLRAPQCPISDTGKKRIRRGWRREWSDNNIDCVKQWFRYASHIYIYCYCSHYRHRSSVELMLAIIDRFWYNVRYEIMSQASLVLMFFLNALMHVSLYPSIGC